MAEANLTVGVEVALRVDEGTAQWLESQGWIRPEQAEQDGVTSRVFAGLHKSAESDVSRVIALHERWVAEGAPPLGTSMARWWDRKLVELHDAIRPPESADLAEEEDGDWDPAEMMAGVSLADLVPDIQVPPARPLRVGGGRAMGGAEAMRHRAARLRHELMSELDNADRVDEMLRMCDVDPSALPDPDCDC